MEQPEMPEVDGLDVRHSYLQVNGVRLHVAEAGSGPPMVLLHGWPQNWWVWRKVMPILAEHHRVVCPDLRGFGWSEAPEGSYDKRTFAEDIIALLDEMGIERTALVGHDWGGWTGFLLAIGHPERFSSYLAMNIITPWPEPISIRALPALVRLWYQVLMATPGVGSFAIRRTPFIRKLISAKPVQSGSFSERDLEIYEQTLRVPERTRASMRLYRTFLTREIPAFLRGRYLGERTRLEVPTLMLFGTADLAVDHRRIGPWWENADQMEVELRDDAGHFTPEDIPEVVADRALRLAAGETPKALAQPVQ